MKLAALEERMAPLLVEVEGQYPRPWMTSMTDLTAAQVFVVGEHQAKTFHADTLTRLRYLDALFNRHGQTCRGLYDEQTGQKPSPTRKNLDVLAGDLSFTGVIETNIICFSAANSGEMRQHPKGVEHGAQIFKTLLDAIRPRVMIVYGQKALKQAHKRITGVPSLAVPNSLADIQPRNATISPMGQAFDVVLIALPSLSPPAFNKWQPWWPQARDKVVSMVRQACPAS